METIMTDDYFQDRLEYTLLQTKETLGIKAKEYVRNGDRMHNFNAGASRKNCIREEVISAFRLKHEISADDIRQDIADGKLPTKEEVEEKFGDIINYFILEKISILHKIDSDENK